jgi:type I restriction enzyme S subunit
MKIPEGWERKQLKDLGRCLTGLTYSPADVTDNSGMLVLRSSNIRNSKLVFDDNVFVNKDIAVRNLTREEDILLCVRNGSRDLIGKSAIITNAGSGVAHGAFMLIFRSSHNKYIFQIFQSPVFLRQVHRNLGATINSINSSDLYKFKFLFPPPKEEKKIAEILSCWDEVIEKTENLITAKKIFKKGVMQKLLSGKARFKGFNGEAGYTKLKGLVKEVSRRNRNIKAETVLSVTNTNGFVVQTEHFDRSVASTDISNYKIVRQGQFGFNPSRVNVGSIAMLEKDIEGALSPMYVIFETVDGKLLPEYMKQFIKSSWFIGHVRCLTQGSVRDSLSFDALEQIRIFAPSIDEQKRIANVLSAIDKEIELLERKRDSLKKQKKGLMQKLLTGKIRVKV